MRALRKGTERKGRHLPELRDCSRFLREGATACGGQDECAGAVGLCIVAAANHTVDQRMVYGSVVYFLFERPETMPGKPGTVHGEKTGRAGLILSAVFAVGYCIAVVYLFYRLTV